MALMPVAMLMTNVIFDIFIKFVCSASHCEVTDIMSQYSDNTWTPCTYANDHIWKMEDARDPFKADQNTGRFV